MTTTSTIPRRLTRRRLRGWTMPLGAVYVGRGRGAAGRWGNPYIVGETLLRHPALSGDQRWEFEGRHKAPGPDQPFTHPGGRVTFHEIRPATPQECVDLFAGELLGRHRHHPSHMAHMTLETVRRELRGRDLVCWCHPGAPCHGDILLWAANAPQCGLCRRPAPLPQTPPDKWPYDVPGLRCLACTPGRSST